MFCTSYILVFSAISYILVFSAYILVFLFFIVILYPRLLGNIQYPNRTPTCKHCIGPSANWNTLIMARHNLMLQSVRLPKSSWRRCALVFNALDDKSRSHYPAFMEYTPYRGEVLVKHGLLVGPEREFWDLRPTTALVLDPLISSQFGRNGAVVIEAFEINAFAPSLEPQTVLVSNWTGHLLVLP